MGLFTKKYECKCCDKKDLKEKEVAPVCLQCVERYKKRGVQQSAEQLVDNSDQNLVEETKKLMSNEDLDLLNAQPLRDGEELNGGK